MHVLALLEYLDKFTEPGDYHLVEDTNPIKPSKIGQGLIKDLGYDPLGNEKFEQLKLFMKDRADRFHVDKYFNDFFGWDTECKHEMKSYFFFWGGVVSGMACGSQNNCPNPRKI